MHQRPGATSVSMTQRGTILERPSHTPGQAHAPKSGKSSSPTVARNVEFANIGTAAPSACPFEFHFGQSHICCPRDVTPLKDDCGDRNAGKQTASGVTDLDRALTITRTLFDRCSALSCVTEYQIPPLTRGCAARTPPD